MAFTKNYKNEIFGTVLVLSALLSTASAVDCHGKSFHCVNSTHFMICVDLGGGVSQAIENFFIACPPPTICQGTNHFECEFPAPTTPVAMTRNVITEATLPWDEVVTAYSTGNITEEFSENYMNTERITTAVEYSVTTDTTVEVTVTTALDFNFAGILPTLPVDVAPNALEAVTDNSSINETGATAKAVAAVVGNVTQTTAATRRLTEIEPATVETTTSRIIDTTAQTVTENVVITETVTTEVDQVAQIATDQIIQTSSEKPVELNTVQLNIKVPQIVDWFQNGTLRNTTTSKDPKTIHNINAHNIEKDLSNKHLSTVANRDTMIPIPHKPNVLVTEGSFRNDLHNGSKSTIKLVTEAPKNKMKHLTTIPVAKITTYEYPSSIYVYENELQKNNRVEETSLNQDKSVLSIKSHADNETMEQLPTGILAHKTPETSQTDYTLQESSTIINEWIDGVNPTTSLVGDVFPEVVITTNMPFIYEENTVAAISNQVVVLTTEHPTNLTTSDGAFGENGPSSEQITAINVEMLTSSTTQTVAAVDINDITTDAVPISTTISNGSAMVTETPLLTTNMQNPVDTTLEGNAVITERPIIINEESLIMDITQNVTTENTNIPITQEVNLDFATTEASNIDSNNIKDSVTGKPQLLVTHNSSDTLFDGVLTPETIQDGASFYEPPTSIHKGAVDTIQNIPVYITVIPPNQAANLDKINTEDKEAMPISTENNNNQIFPITSKASAVSGTQLLTTQNMLEEFYLDGAVTEAVHNNAVTKQRNVYDISFTTDTIPSIVTDKNNQVTIPAVVSITETDGLYSPISITGTQPSVSASQDNTPHKYQKITPQSPNFASATLVDTALTANKLDHDADASTVHPTTMNEEKLALSSAQNAVSVNTINPSNQTGHVDMTTTEAVNMPTKLNNAQAIPGFEDNIIDKTPLSVLDDVVSKVNTEGLTNNLITTPMQLVTKTDDVTFTNVVEPSLNKEHAIKGYEDKVVENDSNNIISNGVTEDQGHIAFASSSSNDFKMENNNNLDQINTLGHLELTPTTKYGNSETLQTGIKDYSASNFYLGPREELTSTTKNNLLNPTVILNTDEPIFRAGLSGAENIEETLLPSTQGSKNLIVPTQSTDAINIDHDKYGKLYPNVVAVNVDQTLENANEQAFSHAFETPQTGRSPITEKFNTANAYSEKSKSETILATNSVQPGTQPSTMEINVQTAKSKPNPESTSKSSVTNINIGTNGNMEALESNIQDKSQSYSNSSNVSLGPQEKLTSTMEKNEPNPAVSYNTDKSTLHTVQSGADNIETTLLQSSQGSKHVIVPTQSTDAINIVQDKYGNLYPNVVAVNVDQTLENANEQAFSHAFETPQTGRSPITDNFNIANANSENSKSETILAINSVQPGTQPSTTEINVQTAKSKPDQESTSKSSVTNVNIGTNGNMEALESSIQDKSQSNNNVSNVSLGPQEELTSTMENNVPNPTVSYNTDKSTLHTVQSGADNIETTLLQSSQGSKHVIVPTQSTDAINIVQDKYGNLYPNVVAVNVDQTLENANEQAFSHAFETPQTGRSPITDNFNIANANSENSKSETILAINSVQPGTHPSTTEINVQTAKSKPNPESTSKSSVTNVNIGTNGNMEALESSIQDKSQSNSNASNVSLGPQEELMSTMENNVPNATVSYNTNKSTLHTVQSGADNIETTLLQSSQSSKHVIVPTQSTDAINIDQDKFKKLYPNVEAENADQMYEHADKNNQNYEFTNKSSVIKINARENSTSTVTYDTQFVSEKSPTSSITTGRSIKAKENEQIIKDTTSSIGISTSNVLAPNDHLATVTELNSVHETYSNRGLKTEVPVRNNGLDLTSPTTASAKINAANNAIITSTQNKYNTVSTLSPSVSTIDGSGNNIREPEKSATVTDNQENKNSQSIKETMITNNLSTADKPKEKVNTFSKSILNKLPLSNQHNKLNTDVTNMPPLRDLAYNSQTENTIIVIEPYIPASSNLITNTNTRVQVYSSGIGISTASTILRPSLNSQAGITNTGNYVYLPKNPSLESSTSTVILPLESIDKNNNIPLVSTLEGAAFNSPTETDVFLQQSPQFIINELSVEKGPSATETNKKNTILISTSTESTKVGISTESVLAETIDKSQKHVPEYSIFNPVHPKNNSTVSKNTSETNYIQITSIGTQKIHTNTVQPSAKTVTSIPISHLSNHQNKQIPYETDRTYTCVNGKRGRYSDKDNCRKFYLCIGNNQPIVGNCPENTVFSDLNKLCTKNLSHCIRKNEFKCPSAGRFSDFMKDAIYYVCINHNNHLYRFKFQCQKGYILNKTTVNCVETKEIESNESVSISSSDNSSQTGITGVGISSANSKTTRTRNGSSTVGNISSKNDDSTKIKQRKETSDISEAKEDEDDDEVFKCKKEGKFPIRNECRKYYLCKKNRKEYRRKIKKCDSDSVFHKDKKKCVDADSYECE